jgi:hypothetical protein
MYRIIGADQKQYGPVTADEMRRWIAEGRVNAQTLVQAEGQLDWRPLSTFPEFAGTPQPLPSGTPIAPGTPVIDARSLVAGPATGLMIVGIICLLAAISGVVSNLVGGDAFRAGGPGAADLPPQLRQWMEMTSGTVGVIMSSIGVLLSILFIFASTKMRRLENYGLVMTATILSMLPCLSPCCCVGLPIGVWILIVLAKPEVKSAFH